MKNEFDNLMETGYTPPEDIAPEDEFFHSIYIAGKQRTNHIGIKERSGQIQIRGVEYNLDEVYFIITHVKPMLVKKEKINDKIKTVCFSYQNTNPWKGTNGKICQTNRADRDNTPACNGCRGEMVIGGILCDEAGKPTMVESKPIFVFIRGRGVKSPNVYKYLDELAKMDTEPPIFPDNPPLEKMVAKNKRFVTVVTVGTIETQHGDKDVFSFTTGTKLDNEFVKEVLRIQQKTISQFNKKFDWSKQDNTTQNTHNEETPSQEIKTESTQNKIEPQKESSGNYSLDDIDF